MDPKSENALANTLLLFGEQMLEMQARQDGLKAAVIFLTRRAGLSWEDSVGPALNACVQGQSEQYLLRVGDSDPVAAELLEIYRQLRHSGTQRQGKQGV